MNSRLLHGYRYIFTCGGLQWPGTQAAIARLAGL
jgi:hypothetical protein